MWHIIIPTSMLQLGGVLLLMAFVTQWITPENNRLAIIFAIIGGFGVGGGVGGWFGSTLSSTTTSVAGFSERWTQQLVGTGYGFLAFAILGLFAYVAIRKSGKGSGGGKGMGKSSGGKGAGSGGGKGKKEQAKQTAWLLAFAMLGTAIAGLPEVYSALDTAVASAGTAALNALP